MPATAVVATFEKDTGFRFTKDGVSILVHFAAATKPGVKFTNPQINNLFAALAKYVGDVGTYVPATLQFSPLLNARDFNHLDDASFYKFISAATLERWQQGSLQLGSVNYYRATENEKIRDQFEGRSCLVISGPSVQTALMIQSGCNFGILCGTAQVAEPNIMRERYGDVLVRITSLRAFAEHVKGVLGARRYYFNHVQYNDLKLFRLKTLMRRILATNTFDEKAFGEKAFELLHREAFLPSLFMKPTGFADDRELRLVFELDADLNRYVRPQVPDLKHSFEVVG